LVIELWDFIGHWDLDIGHFEQEVKSVFFLSGIWNGLGEIRAHKLRSSLTIVCVLLGVASLVLIAGFITGLFQEWDVFQQEMGWAQKVQVEQAQVPDYQRNLKAISPGRTMADVRAIERLSVYAEDVSPEMRFQPLMAYQGNTYMQDVTGVTQGVMAVRRYRVDRGRFISDIDLDRAEQVIVLGSEPVKELFNGHEDPLGKVITLNRQPFRVIGLLHDYVSMDGTYNILSQKNRVAFIPITSMQRRLLGLNQLDELTVQVKDTKNLNRLVAEINSILMRTHRGVYDFRTSTEAEFIEEQNAFRRNFFVVGCGVGVITLLVGGIGIMNLMLASINERVREIGIRKAIGAWNRDIFAQFIAEAIALSTLGGLAGVGVGVMGVRIMRHVMSGGRNSPPVLSAPAILIGLGFSVFVGIVAGLYPALRASRLDPIEALRYE
jgi:putative ABC transport system permease protein